MLTASFWKGAAERAIKTIAQSLLAVLGVTGIGFGDVDWIASLSVAGLAGVASILTSIVNPTFTAGDTVDTTDEFPDIDDPETVENIDEGYNPEEDTETGVASEDYTPRHSA